MSLTSYFSVVGDQTIQDPHALGARQTSIHVLLELVNAGILRFRGKRKEKGGMGPPVDPLFLTLPGLAERCYRVLYQLCIHREHLTSQHAIFALERISLPTK